MTLKNKQIMNILDNDLISIQEARIIAENAFTVQRKLASLSQEELNKIVENMVNETKKFSAELARISSDETEYGRWQDKFIKNNFICEYLFDNIKDMHCVGIINEDKEKKTIDIGVPVGVIAALCPSTSPVSTTIFKAVIAVKSGNSIIFSPHPRAKNSIIRVLEILIKAAEKSGLPRGAISYMKTVTPSGTKELMNHNAISLIMNTGVPGMLKHAYCSGKPVIYGGQGNGPAFIERTADIKQAVADIIESKAFDNGTAAAAEQSIVVDSCIDIEVKKELKLKGAYFMSEDEDQKFTSKFFNSRGCINKEMIGKSPQILAEMSGFSLSENVRVLISEQKYVSHNSLYTKVMLAPALAYYVEDDWMNACEKCIELLISEIHGHTLVIHSKDEKVIREFALKKPVGRLLVNTSATFGSMGATTNLFPAMTLGSGSAGEGITSDNISPMNLIYIRKVGYGVRNTEEFKYKAELNNDKYSANNFVEKKSFNSDDMEKMLRCIVEKVLEDLEN